MRRIEEGLFECYVWVSVFLRGGGVWFRMFMCSPLGRMVGRRFWIRGKWMLR